jgi:hypothetical protein
MKPEFCVLDIRLKCADLVNTEGLPLKERFDRLQKAKEYWQDFLNEILPTRGEMQTFVSAGNDISINHSVTPGTYHSYSGGESRAVLAVSRNEEALSIIEQVDGYRDNKVRSQVAASVFWVSFDGSFSI